MSGHEHLNGHVADGHAVATATPHVKGFPWKHVIGYILSLVLTFGALWLVLKSPMSVPMVLTSIVVLAIFQVFVQLLFFMHLNESHGPAYHTLLLAFGFFTAIMVVGGSIWIMGFSNTVS